MHPLYAAAAALTLASVLGACGSSSADTATGPRSIEDLFDPANFAARETKVQQAVADCMRAKGWEYTPVDASSMMFGATIGGDVSPDDRATKGYGISTGMLTETIEPTSGSDPNADYMTSLSEADREAYQFDLYGDMSEFEGDDGGTFVIAAGGDGADPFADNTGCFAEAQRSVPQEGPDFTELGPALQELDEQITADPRMIEATEQWSACMDEAGFDFADPEDIFTYLFGKMGNVPVSGGDGTATGEVQIGVVSGGAGLGEAELSALQSEEIAVALADGQCADSTGYATTSEEVRAEYEARFFDEHPELG